MRKETFTTQLKGLLLKTKQTFLFCAFIFVFTTGNVSAQCPLACDNLVQVSLDADCKALITPSMILQDSGINCTYRVVVYDLNNLPIPDNTVRSRHVGKYLTVAVFNGLNSCWGSILVEDKLPPIIRCPEPDTFFCNQLNYTLKSPLVYDSCSAVFKEVISDNIIEYPCDSVWAGKRIIRFYYRDASGNRSDTCSQVVCFRRINPEIDVLWPRDTIFDCLVMDTVPGPSVTGVPTAGGESLYPNWGKVCKIGISYEDQIIPICPKAFKVLRKWTFIDWCRPGGQNIYIHYQVIKVIDDRGPIVACAPNITINTDIWTCKGTAILATPTIIQECSKTTVQVGYKIVSQAGSPTFEGTSTNNITKLQNGLYSIAGLPLGTSWVVFRVTDECGNYTDCATEVTVEDKVPPVAVCIQKTVVTLTIDGSAKVPAIAFDNRSHDNCGILSFEAKRMDNGVPCNTPNGNEWGPYVYFCCADIGKTLMVSMRVWDVHGNSNTCMVEIEVQDKLPPIIYCPPDITISCEFDFTDLNVFGTVRANAADRKAIKISDPNVIFNGPALDGYAYDGCGVTIKEEVTYDIKCGNGRIYRRFEAKDPGGLTSFCIQTITINDYTPNNISVQWPNDYVSNTNCMTKPLLSPDVTGKPLIIGADKCANIIQTYDDVVFTLDPDACLKILRKWVVIDWCTYNPNVYRSPGYWTWTQVLKITNNVAPTFFISCTDRIVDVFGPGCQGHIDLRASAKDDCTDSLSLVWYHEVDIDNNGSIDTGYSGPGRDASGVYPVGVHKITFRVTDGCMNSAVCSFLLTVRDGKKPTPYCIGHIVTTVMPSSKNIEIWAKDFNLNSEDNCTPKDSLKYYFLVNGRFEPSLKFDCSNIGKNILRMYVVDKAGNSDYCEVTLEIQDPNGVCPTGITIQGNVTAMNNKGVKDVVVSWERLSPAGTNSTYTNQNGMFSFANLGTGMSYTIKAEKNTEFSKGVSTLDIVMIQRHILGIQTFDTPYKYLAADVNESCTITASDISEIRKLILGVTNAFSKTTSWKFVPVNSVVPTPYSPCGFEHAIKYNLINRNEMNTDFYGIKMGDINFDVDAGSFQQTSGRSGNQIQMYSNDELITAGTLQSIPVYLSEGMTLTGLQFALKYNTESIQQIQVKPAQLRLNEESYYVDNGRILVSIAESESSLIDASKPLFYIMLTAAKNAKVSELILFDPKSMNAECYDEHLNVYTIQFDTRSAVAKQSVSAILYQNSPNPFDESTTIGFEIPKKQEVEFVFYQMNGKVIHKLKKIYGKGYHELQITKSDLNTFGVLFMQMNTEDFTDTKRLILVR